MSVDASVIVPAFNAAATLPACLSALRAQDAGGFEIIVADDGSSDATAAIVAEAARIDPRVRLVRLERNVGAAAARNQAIRAAAGTLLLLTDADCVVAPDWVRRHRAAQRQASIVGGAVVGMHRTVWGRADGYASWFDSLPGQPAGWRRNHHLPTANLSVARHVFERVGLFREGERLYSEDAEFCERARRAGEPLWYDPAIVVRHRDRDTPREFLRHHWTAGIQMLNYRREPGARYRRLMPRGPLGGALLAVPLAAAYTALIAARWAPREPRVLAYVPLLLAAKLAQTIAMAAYSRTPSAAEPRPPMLPARSPE